MEVLSSVWCLAGVNSKCGVHGKKSSGSHGFCICTVGFWACSLTIWKAYIKRSALRIWSNFLARMLCQEPRSSSGLVNLDEAGRVSMMSTSAAHQQLLLQLQTSRQQKKIIRAKPRVTTREIQESLSIRMAVTMSILHDHLRVRKQYVQGGSTTRWQMNNDGVRLSAWCEFMLRKFTGVHSKLTWEVQTGNKTGIYRYDPETKMQSMVWLFPDNCPPQKQKKITQHTEENGCVSSENRAMSPPLLLRTDGQSLRTGTCITVSRRSSKFGASATQRRDSMAFFCIMTMLVSTQQQQRLTFSMRARCSCCRTDSTRQTSLPATSSYSQKWRNNWRVPCLRARKIHVVRSWGLLKTYPNQPGLRSGTSGFTAWQSA